MIDESLDSHNRRDALRLGGTLVASAVGAGLLAAQASAQEKPTTGGLKLALVDIGVVFKNYKRKDDLEKQINAKKESLENQAKEQGNKIEGVRKQLELLKADTPLWRQKRNEVKLLIKEAEAMRDSMDEELKLEVENLTLMILDEIEEKVREFGKSQGYDFVLKVDSKGWGDERFQERIFRAQVSSVLYYDARLDVTNTVLASLNDPAWIDKCQKRQLQGGGTNGTNGNAPQTPGPQK
jgi:Skp family chaperone for outer membrane proteins